MKIASLLTAHKGRGVLFLAVAFAMFFALATSAVAVPASISGTIWHWDDVAGADVGTPCQVTLFDGLTYAPLQTMQTVDGTYSFGVDYGNYIIGASDGDGPYRNTYTGNASSIVAGYYLEVSADFPTLVEQDVYFMDPYDYSISGTVRDDNGQPVFGAMVEVMYDDIDFGWQTGWTYWTDFDGTYYAGFMSTGGPYKLRISGPNLPPDYFNEYVGEYWTAAGGVAANGDTDPTFGDDVNVVGDEIADANLTRLPRVAGTVTSDGVTGIGGIRVFAYYPVESEWGTQWDWAGDTVTAADGTYVLRGLQANDIRIEFQDNTGSFLSQAWSDQTFPPAKSVYDDAAVTFTASNNATETKDVTLLPAVSVSGVVTTDGGSLPASASVTVYTQGGSDGDFWWNNNEAVDVSAEGTYSIGGLDPAVPTKVCFNSKVPAYLSEFFDDFHGDDVYSAPEIDFSGGSRADISADLEAGGTIAGHVSDGTNPVAGMLVTICSPNTVDGGVNVPEEWESRPTTVTDADGNYFITGLNQGDYGVYFSGTEGLLPEYYDNQRSASTATTLSLTYGQTESSIDATLEPAARAIGRFTTKMGVGIADAWVGVYQEVYDEEEGGYYWTSVDATFTAADGTFAIEGLEPGPYRFRVTHDVYLGGYVTTDTVQADKDGSTEYTLEAGITKDLGTRQLEKGGAISGTISVPAGVVEPSLNVTVYKQNESWFDEMGTVDADASGKYGFTGLPAGKYRVGFGDYSGQCVGEFYADQEFIELSSDVSVSLATTTPLNAALAKGASLSGNIKVGASSVGFDAASASAYAWDEFWGNWAYQGDGWTSDEGMYTIRGLRPRTAAAGYRLRAAYGSYSDKWWLNKSYDTPGTDGIDLLTGQAKGGANFVFAAPGSISGTVTIENLAPAEYGEDAWAYISLWAKLSDGTYEWADGTSTDDSGHYSFDAVQPGQYSLRFSSSGKLDGYNGGGSTFTPFSVVSGGALTFNHNLTDGATLGGAVYGSDGRPASGEVTLFDGTGNQVRWQESETGEYSFEDVAPGTYDVLASPTGGTPGCPTLFGGSTNAATNTQHVSVASLDTTNNDITLAPGASISGTITVASNGSPLENARVRVVPTLPWMTGAKDILSPWYYGGNVYSGPDGAYSADTLIPGPHRVEFMGTDTYAGQDSFGMPLGYGTGTVNATGTASFAVKKSVKIYGEVWQQAYVRPRHTLEVNLWFSKTAAGTFTKMTPSTAVGRDGRFSVWGNLPGYYKLEMVDKRGFYLPTYYNKAPFTLISATTEGADVNLGKWYLTSCYPTSAMDTTHYYQVVYPTTYWSTVYSSSYYGGSARKSRYALARHYTQFNGTKYTMYGSKGPSNGKFKVYIDGVYKTTVSTYAVRGANKVPLYTVSLAPGVHKVKLQTVSSAPVVLDRVYVVGAFQRAARW